MRCICLLLLQFYLPLKLVLALPKLSNSKLRLVLIPFTICLAPFENRLLAPITYYCNYSNLMKLYFYSSLILHSNIPLLPTLWN